VKRASLLCCLLLSLAAACVPHPPEIPYPPSPAEPLQRSLEEQRRAFESLKALARVETVRKGRRRVYESVAILMRGTERLRVEGYGPLGQRIFTLLWDGKNVLFDPADGSGMRSMGRSGLEAALGVALKPEDLCAVLAGIAPSFREGSGARAGCSSDGRCAVDIPREDGLWRIHSLQTVRNGGEDLRITAAERYRGGDVALLVRYERENGRDGTALPTRVIILDPGRDLTLTVEYLDADVNVPLDEGTFSPDENGKGGS
jgi:hypothetical protein